VFQGVVEYLFSMALRSARSVCSVCIRNSIEVVARCESTNAQRRATSIIVLDMRFSKPEVEEVDHRLKL
jgi:hypothetical protein